MSRRPVTVQAVLDALAPAQRESLLALNPHLAAPKTGAARRKQEPVFAVLRRDGARLVLWCKGLRLVSEANAHEPWPVRARRARAQGAVVAAGLAEAAPMPTPCVVTIARVGRALLDSDNLVGSAKHVRDAVAAWLGVGDSPSDPVRWEVTQERGEGYATRVVIAPEGVE